MKINNLKTRILKLSEAKKRTEDDDFDDFAEFYGRDYYDDSPDYGIQKQDEQDSLGYEIRKILSGYGIEGEVDSEENYGLCIRINLQKKEKMGTIIKILDTVLNKVKRDILPQYEAEVELFETTAGLPVLEFDFYLLDNTESPF